MQFKHPEVLYFLALLIIPILVHLFQLQRFEKVAFTNVAFLKKLQLQTRKSSRLKKWLILLTRLLLLIGLILAFAQPYFSDRKAEEKPYYTIYLDNSLSLNSNGVKGNLLKNASQEIIENIPKNLRYSLITNSNNYTNLTYNSLKDLLLKLENTSEKKTLESVLLQLKNSETNQTKNIVISDFQNATNQDFLNLPNNISLVKTLPEKKYNLSIDSVYTNNNNTLNTEINILVNNHGIAQKNIPISIYNNDKLINKQTFSIDKNTSETVTFLINKSDTFNGRVHINFDDVYSFDNTFYFTINNNEKTNVLAIGNDNEFLKRLYSKDEFNFVENNEKSINYNLIKNQQLIVLNELNSIAKPLINSLITFSKNGGNIIIIPNKESNLNNYNSLFNQLKIGRISEPKKDSLKITSINFNHPFFNNVFEKKVTNFQYPNSLIQYETATKNSGNLISYENNKAFLKEIKVNSSSVFWFSSPLNKESSNFTNSPLIVPVFYTIGLQSLQNSKLYYTIGLENKIDIQKQLGKDDILSIANNKTSFIPLQRTFQNKVTLTTTEQPYFSGIYKINQEENTIQNIAYNYAKNESNLSFFDINKLTTTQPQINISNSVKDSITTIEEKTKVHWLYKWFLALAIVSLLLEILIIKFFKP